MKIHDGAVKCLHIRMHIHERDDSGDSVMEGSSEQKEGGEERRSFDASFSLTFILVGLDIFCCHKGPAFEIENDPCPI